MLTNAMRIAGLAMNVGCFYLNMFSIIIIIISIINMLFIVLFYLKKECLRLSIYLSVN